MISKIIYFDKETIKNILQEQNHGSVIHTTDKKTSIKMEAGIEISGKVNLNIPFWERIAFLFSGKLDAAYISKLDKKITITSTEISEFEKLKPKLKKYNRVMLSDIENSSTFFRVAGGYLRMFKGEIDEVDIKEFKAVMDGYEGYDTYKISDTEYVRFNNTAFVSNYKRNDILRCQMMLYCISVGEFFKENFDFFEELNKMEALISTTTQSQKLADVYPSAHSVDKQCVGYSNIEQVTFDNNIKLYDVVYACIRVENDDER